MNLRVRLKPNAATDLADAMAWYDGEQSGLGNEFLNAVDDTLRRIASHPMLYRECRPGVRLAVLKRFPYLVFFIPEPEEIVVLACLHNRRNPRRWPKS
jgi:plasmid stabilization system protein ParE